MLGQKTKRATLDKRGHELACQTAIFVKKKPSRRTKKSSPTPLWELDDDDIDNILPDTTSKVVVFIFIAVKL